MITPSMYMNTETMYFHNILRNQLIVALTLKIYNKHMIYCNIFQDHSGEVPWVVLVLKGFKVWGKEGP